MEVRTVRHVGTESSGLAQTSNPLNPWAIPCIDDKFSLGFTLIWD
jgi:hypothetical protein